VTVPDGTAVTDGTTQVLQRWRAPRHGSTDIGQPLDSLRRALPRRGLLVGPASDRLGVDDRDGVAVRLDPPQTSKRPERLDDSLSGEPSPVASHSQDVAAERSGPAVVTVKRVLRNL
jgi:hypothetical protein